MARVIGGTDARTLAGFVRNVVDTEDVELLATAEKQDYRYADEDMPHEAVNHSEHEYVRGVVHTNNIESFWSLLTSVASSTRSTTSARNIRRFNSRKNPDIFQKVLALA